MVEDNGMELLSRGAILCTDSLEEDPQLNLHTALRGAHQLRKLDQAIVQGDTVQQGPWTRSGQSGYACEALTLAKSREREEGAV